jgi:uncharacterized protein (DUF2249 family)
MQGKEPGMTAASQAERTDVLDVRGIQPPSNVLAVLKRVGELPNGCALQIRADSNPWQLYDLLQQRGYFLEMRRESDGSYTGTIRQRNLGELKH